MQEKKVKLYFAMFIVVILLVVAFFIFKPFLSAILISAVLALVFYPVYTWLLKHLKYKTVSAFFATFIAFLVVIIPIAIISYIVGLEVLNFYSSGLFDSLMGFITSLSSSEAMVGFAPQISEGVMGFFVGWVSNVLFNLPTQILNFFITVFTTFTFILTGDEVVQGIKDILPFKKKDKLFAKIKTDTNAVIYGFIIIAIIDFVLAIIGFYILGIPHTALWALVVAFLVIIPFMGPTIFWVPYSIVLFVQGHIGMGIGLVVLGGILSAVETFARPWLIGKKANIHPVVVLIGVLGGISVFGISGIILGPVILSLTFTLLKEITTKR